MSLNEINKLMCFQQSLEKSILNTINNLRKFSNEDIVEIYLTQEKQREEEKDLLQLEMKQITDKLYNKKEFLKSNGTLNSSDLEQFKNEMISIQDSIRNGKINCKLKLKTLNIEYIDIIQDVDYYTGKMLEWSEPNNIKDLLNVKVDYNRRSNDLKCVEVREFMDFIRKSGGHENGWSKDDHQLFIKFRNKFKDTAVVCQKINEIFPDKSIEDVKSHDEWYKRYLLLKKNKQEALKRWQDSKNKKTRLVITQNNIPNNKIVLKQPQEDLKEKLKKWQSEREAKMRNSLLMDELKEERKRELDNLRKKKNEEVKKAVKEWKAIKISLEQENQLKRKYLEEQEKKRKAAEANKLIKQFQTQDDYHILKMKQHKKRLEVLLPVRSKSSHVAQRDPDRILKPTRQWINRVHDENIYPTVPVIPLKKLPKLRVPDWRKNTVGSV
ncbi:coiled-coil domain-containing protein 112-like [Diorhabda sublineata]|uniref:coiled-coil domain-containing protein 112-like n=1 Tax=Diorhabda sublineata TaxID=1163346 RepID=UPI0024E0D87C|nr:coiled-coil domain-containing protein 112-like [Diorhabda sublineata]